MSPPRPAVSSPVPLLADAGLLVATFLWGLSFVVVREGLESIPPLRFVAARFALACACLLPLALRRASRPQMHEIRAGLILGLWLFLGFAGQTLGLRTCPPARAAFLTGMAVVCVPLFLLAFYRRPVERRAPAWVALAVAGLAALTGGLGGLSAGDAWVLFGAAAFAFQVIEVSRNMPRARLLPVLTVEFALVALAAAAASALLEPAWEPPSARGIQAVAVTALLATLGALGLQHWAQRSVPPVRAAVIFVMEPVFAALVSFYWTGERLTPVQLLGCGLILAAMLGVEWPAARSPVGGRRW